jgi:hypothetical protein
MDELSNIIISRGQKVNTQLVLRPKCKDICVSRVNIFYACIMTIQMRKSYDKEVKFESS